MRWINYPALMTAIETLCSCNNMAADLRKFEMLVVPPAWAQRVIMANDQAGRLINTRLSDWIPDNLIDRENADPNDSALTTLCDGEDSTMQALVVWSVSSELHEVLNAVFDGELHDRLLE